MAKRSRTPKKRAVVEKEDPPPQDDDVATEESASDDYVESSSDGEHGEHGEHAHDDGDEAWDSDEPMGEPTEDGDDDEQPRAAKRVRVNMARPPTAEEMEELQETEELFKSNMFRLAMTEMLKEVVVEPARTTSVQFALRELREHLLGLPALTLSLKDAAKRFPHAGIRNSTKKGELAFAAPTDVKVVGSFLVHTVTKKRRNVDVCMQMPATCFTDKDFLNHRYADKRAAYLHVVGESLRATAIFGGVQLEAFHGDVGKPILVVKPRVKASGHKKTSFVIRIHPTIAPSVFALTKLRPGRNNVRARGAAAVEGADKLPATPHYNASVLEDMFMVEHLAVVHEWLQKCTSGGEAMVLLKIWLAQRGYDTARDGWNGFCMSMLMVYLFQKRRISKAMSSYQMLKIVFDFLANTDLTAQPLALARGADASDNAPALTEFAEHYDVALVDASGFLNVAARVSAGAMADLRRDAEISLAALEDKLFDGFEALFIERVEPHVKYDVLIGVEGGCAEGYLSPHAIADENAVGASLRKITTVLDRALSDRVTMVRPMVPASVPCAWALGEAVPTPAYLQVGVMLDGEQARRKVDKGPSAEDKAAAAAFRAFWGDKSELRRFQDGAIVEALVWDSEENAAHTIVHRIVAYILQRQCGIDAHLVHMTGRQVDDVISRAETHMGDEAATMGVIGSLGRLSQLLRGLDDVPLKMTTIQGVSPAFRYTEVLPILPNPIAGGKGGAASKYVSRCVRPLHVLVQFESSSKWPDNIDAIRNLKTAFYLKIGDSLERKHIPHVVTATHLDVFYEGYAFRLHISHERELTLLRTMVSPDALFALERQLVALPWHAGAVHATASAYPAFGRTVRLAKRWVSTHLFSTYLVEEAVELLVAHTFVHSRPFAPPQSHFVGLLRFLRLLATFEWHAAPLIVDIGHDMTPVQVQAATEAFEKAQKTKHCPPMFLATANDTTTSRWTRGVLPAKVFARLVLLATRSYELMSAGTLHVGSVEAAEEAAAEKDTWERLFHTPLHDFDVLLHLDPVRIPRIHDSVDGVEGAQAQRKGPFALKYYKNLQIKPDGLLVGFNPVQTYVTALRARFGNQALFFHDECGGSTIAVAWRPRALLVQERFKIAHAVASLPLASGGVHADVVELLHEMRAMGKGLVLRAEVLKSSFAIQ